MSDVRLPAVTPEPVSKAANHRAFQNLVDENYSLKTELKRKDEKLKSNKGKIKVGLLFRCVYISIRGYPCPSVLLPAFIHVILCPIGCFTAAYFAGPLFINNNPTEN